MSELTELDWHFINGYRVGRTQHAVCRADAHPAFKHSFRIGRAEIERRPIPIGVSERRVAMIEAALAPPTITGQSGEEK